jgi:tetratricopeptide (TPR) repeat protein
MMSLRRLALAFAFALLLPSLPVSATCGGGGGGGNGGAVPSVGGEPAIYRVSWTVLAPGAEKPRTPLAVYWFPTSPTEAKASPLQTSRALSLASGRCVGMALVTPDNQPLHDAFKVPSGEMLVVVDGADGSELGRLAAQDGKLNVGAVEKLLSAKLDEREDALKNLVKGAEKKAASDKEGAIADYKQVWDQRCLFPSLGKKAAKGLTKLGSKPDETSLLELGPDGLEDPDVHSTHTAVAGLLRMGLEAENAARYLDAERAYTQAAEADPADATPLRFLGELYRHQTGDWAKARTAFERVLAMPADPIARAVALHGLGKMTIHGGRFADGLALFERSLAAYPLPITYRNLAVYWFSEQQAEKAAGFMRQALALDPDDRYNQIFAAVYLAAAGQKDEAAKIASANHEVLEASYNLAAIWAQVGDRKKAMELLRRHFYEYEQFDGVRAMEMQEARDDYMFASLREDPEFVKLTRLADGHSMK